MAHPDCDLLFDQSVHAAVDLLEKSGGFSPFAMHLRDDGSVAMAAPADDSELPPPEEAEEMLRAGIAADTESGIQSAALVANVQMTDESDSGPTDAIRVLVQRRGEDAVAVFAPYTLQNKTCEIGEVTATPGDRSLFE